jgi:cobalt-zinc-cadmium efflux system membrane fusion protein
MRTTFSKCAAALTMLALAAAGCGNGADRRAAESRPESGAHGAEEEAVVLSAEAMRLAGIGISEIGRESIGHTIEMPGEIGYNEERRIHITPRYAGVIREVRARLGESVREGEVLAIVESNTSLTPYEIAAPIAGRVVDVHAALGEFVGEDRTLFVVADLSTVWANCDVFAEDLPHVRIGQDIAIAAVGSTHAVQGTVSYISTALNEQTRAAVVRAVLPGSPIWRPGVFIRGTLRIPGGDPVVAVARDAVQLLGETHVIFVEGDEPGEFRPAPGKTGRSDGTFVELLEGPPPGTKYVSAGAFDLKAQIVTRESGSHAGHGH